MAILKVAAFEAGPAKSGVSLSIGESNGRSYFRLGITAFAQTDLFGRAIDPAKDALKLVVNNDPQTRHLMGMAIVPCDDPQGIPVLGSMKDSVFCKLQPWNGASGKRPAVALDIINRAVGNGMISVRLPEFAKPPAVHAPARKG